MKRHKDALKKERQATKQRARNQSAIAAIKTLRKKAAAAAKGEEREKALRQVVSAVGRAARKGVLHRNTASRIVSRVTKSAAK